MSGLEWPEWFADRYTYRVIPVSPREVYGGEFIVTREALEDDRLGRDALRAYMIRVVTARAEEETGGWHHPAGFDVALVDDRFPNRPLARDVHALRDVFTRDELRNHAP